MASNMRHASQALRARRVSERSANTFVQSSKRCPPSGSKARSMAIPGSASANILPFQVSDSKKGSFLNAPKMSRRNSQRALLALVYK